MKKAFAVFSALILMPGLNAHAWVGGPWSNDSYQHNGDDGVYEAVATATNGIGIYRWGVSNNGGNLEFAAGSFASSNLWYYRGISYYGMCFGIVNSHLGVVSVVGNGTTDLLKSTTTVDADTGTVITVTIGLLGPDSSTASGNIAFCNSAFTAKISSKAPVKRFQGKGQVSFTGQPDTETTTTNLTYTTNPSGTTVTENTTSSGGESEEFPQRGKSVFFKVIGSQVSLETNF